jgi:hypothetical protein
VFRANINGDSVCVVYDGQVENISGADDITLLDEIGSESLGACNNCVPIPSQTPTPTPTNTPTPTPTKPSIPCKKFNVYNSDYFGPRNYTYKDCEDTPITISVGAGITETICASSAPQTTYFTVDQDGFC